MADAFSKLFEFGDVTEFVTALDEILHQIQVTSDLTAVF